LEVRQAARADLEAARAERKTFKDAAAGWRELINKKPRAEKTRDRDERMISYLTGAFGNKPIDEVEAKDLIDLLETFEDNESYETRARLQAAALNIGGYAHGKAWIEHNPFLCIAYGKAFTSPTNRPRPAITEAEPFGQLLRDVAAYSGRRGNLVRKALDLLALTFVRPGTVTQAEWDEFDLDGALWTILQETETAQIPREHQGAERQAALCAAVATGVGALARAKKADRQWSLRVSGPQESTDLDQCFGKRTQLARLSGCALPAWLPFVGFHLAQCRAHYGRRHRAAALCRAGS
jgi:integrase